MRSSSQATVTWLLAALFAVVAGFGEGLHCVPGLGHAVERPGGLFYLGLAKPHAPSSERDRWPGVSRLPGGLPLVLDEDHCALCGHFSQGQCVAKPVDFVLVLKLVEYLPELAFRRFSSSVARPFDARAPPVA